MNVNGGPITNSVVFMGSDRNDPELREMAEESVADVGAFAVLLGGNDEEVGRGLLHVVVYVRLVCYFSDNLDPGLLRECLEEQFAHELGFVRDQDPKRSDHCLPLWANQSWPISINAMLYLGRFNAESKKNQRRRKQSMERPCPE